MSTQSLERSPAEVVPMDDDQLLPLGDSILASWIRSICQTVRGYGVSPEAIFERIGMDPTLLTVPDARYPPENRGIYTQSDSPKKSSRNIWSLAVVSVDQRY